MWYIFPQLQGLGRSCTSQIYGIHGLEEARAYLNDPFLGGNLREISQALPALECDDASYIFGYPDDLKFRSCMTLFAQVAEENSVFKKVLDKFFGCDCDARTLRMLGMN